MSEQQEEYKFSGYNALKYTPVPDEFFDWQMQDLGLAEIKVLLYIFRRTFGFKKWQDRISRSQFLDGIVKENGERLDRGCGIKNGNSLTKALTTLEKHGFIQSDFYCNQCNGVIDRDALVPELRTAKGQHTDGVPICVQVVPDKCPNCKKQLRGYEVKYYFLNIRRGVGTEMTYPSVPCVPTGRSSAYLTRNSIQDTVIQEQEEERELQKTPEQVLDDAGLFGALSEERKNPPPPTESPPPSPRERIASALEGFEKREPPLAEVLMSLFYQLSSTVPLTDKAHSQCVRELERDLASAGQPSYERAEVAMRAVFDDKHEKYGWYHPASPFEKQWHIYFSDALRSTTLKSKKQRPQVYTTTNPFTGEVTECSTP